MKKTVLLSLVAATVLFTGCSEETKKAASETATAAKETTHSAVKDAKEAVKETAEKAVETGKKVAERAKEKATEAIEATKEVAAPVVEEAKETIAETTEAVEETVAPESEELTPAEEVSDAAAPAPETEEASAAAGSEAGKALYAKCAACHGVDGKTKALGKSELLTGQSAADLETKITEYKAGTRNVNGMGALMKGQVATMSDEDIKALSAYIATF